MKKAKKTALSEIRSEKQLARSCAANTPRTNAPAMFVGPEVFRSELSLMLFFCFLRKTQNLGCIKSIEY